MVRLLLLLPCVVAADREEEQLMLQHNSLSGDKSVADVALGGDIKRSRGAATARSFCQTLCDPAMQCKASIGGDVNSDNTCAAICDVGCDSSAGEDCTQPWFVKEGHVPAVDPADYALCQTTWVMNSPRSRNENMCDEANLFHFDSAIRHYCSSECKPGSGSKSGQCTEKVQSSFTQKYKTCRKWCSVDQNQCAMNVDNVVGKVCNTNAQEPEDLDDELALRADPATDYSETLWHGSCPTGFEFALGRSDGHPMGYVPKDVAEACCNNPSTCPDAKVKSKAAQGKTCCSISETSWGNGGGAGEAHWLQGDKRRIGKCGKNWQGKTTIWRSCKHTANCAASPQSCP